ncbi:MAG: hypothetical protein PVI42_18490, partial [Desulfobacterales bacterium]
IALPMLSMSALLIFPKNFRVRWMFPGRTHFARSPIDCKSSCTFANNEISDGGNSKAMKVRRVDGMLND